MLECVPSKLYCQPCWILVQTTQSEKYVQHIVFKKLVGSIRLLNPIKMSLGT